ncbi:integral membrane protein [[Actinomadura] parvosata subsp. kistnae]|uniref:Transport permease protein n=1 Tax=[Actinomadura] parvosata subsp. kistnae TaxID=1909395 RepID=A0A1V0ACG7_9ACTN|nr:ABC transporter permease [Nonomuraea sp. ATCC 55076]AQZ67887.1 ABC transporter [Nonomuraea sp. ATCC 55076]SPL93769.1 integral membrane protein [Actinomadura parvosata subsp. kistnae]
MKLLAMEAKLHLRDWPTLMFSIGLPVGLLLILGLSIPSFTELQDTGERIVDTHMPSTMALLSLLTLSCSVLPAVLATYRQQGVLRRLSTTPVHPARVLGAQLLINLAVGTVATAVLIVAGWLAFGAAPPRQWGWFVLVFLLGTAAMMALGLVIAALAPSAKAAQGIGSLVMFPLMFLGGVWLPRELMPEPVRVVSDFSVAGPFAQALKDTWAGQPPQLIHLVVVAAGLVVFGAIAVRSFRWE